MSRMPEVNPARLLTSLADFAAIGATPAGGVNRQALSVEDRAARRLLAERALARGFTVFQDEAANLFLRRDGRDATLPPLLIGSHLDSQPTGGRFDGALGTLTAFEVLEALADAGVETDRAIEVVAFTNEEGSRFSPGCMGSMAFAGAGDMSDWRRTRATDGALLADELAATLQALPEARMRPIGHAVSAFVELHIEQGPVLEREDVPIGVVTAVQGTKWLEIAFSGEAAHAGTTPLEFRKDPMGAAAAAIARIQGDIMPADPAARLTVGRIAAEPGSINVIPSRVSFTVDIRHPDAVALAAMERRVREECEAAGARWDCGTVIELRVDMTPGRFDPEVAATIEETCRALAIRCRPMVSGAFHDALFVGRVAPAAMIFVPCRNGISHNEAEFVSDAHIIAGARTLLGVALRLSAA
ncbi:MULTISPECIES: Zn-dependent hydrolase [unclassified Shinella]|uniref:Zn-dependent hydrolase n=1 Tax=unclassified Shinella TaxID=2643062 RepID=UPI00225DBB64|nr:MULTISPECIES: Zn-dependent hydrolase [unclassified Shinella]MCO5137821.1 Zn-dependent hydrolase [Shinella sp.]MDC7257938.1 Zn-dependent hydrolase [Shinella sp. YE25]CAI0335311.1 N-carbamoyl-L-amino-acid hydrolase [Rhizobiaceae bacterium]CAK7259621.1 beta-ureidopropionase / N-carbamoyl-L-amino-acid hydrolase [Shinella sp. WSC3-e]